MPAYTEQESADLKDPSLAFRNSYKELFGEQPTPKVWGGDRKERCDYCMNSCGNDCSSDCSSDTLGEVKNAEPFKLDLEKIVGKAQEAEGWDDARAALALAE